MPKEESKVQRPQPNFILIGAQKAGTTWVGKQLERHPDVYFVPGEPQFFNRRFYSFDDYLKLFTESHCKKIIGEKTPDYLHMSLQRIKLLHKELSPLRLAVVLRRPSERAWSQARMEASGFNRRQLGNADRDRLVLKLLGRRNRQRTAYASSLSRWLSVFERNQILVLFYDQLKADPKGFMSCLTEYLGICSSDICLNRAWESPSAEIPEWIYGILNQIDKSEATELRRIGISTPTCWTVPYVSKNGSNRDFDIPLPVKCRLMTSDAIYKIYDFVRDQLPIALVRELNRLHYRINQSRSGIDV